ncbi:methyltransferase domain-containing protein [Arenibacter algicola]|uniref:methyltransferase n=1 Tax=Arenibacter algicola TaxID=616991 RepID=UPI001C06E598|nr:methyltransferase [Arenibacter algicola]MBU2904846.1 methyltransferase domain-containing protein [Arenibacter algicola]
METTTQVTVDPSKIMQVGTGFFGTKTLLTAVNMELFTVLAKRELSGKDIQSVLGLHSRSLYDFLDALVAMDFLKRKGIKESALYSNAEDTNFFLDKNKPSYMGGMLEMCNNRLYPFWNDLEDGLKTGLPQNETKNGGKPIFEAVYADPKKLREFVGAMAGVQMGNFIEFAKVFNFSNYKTLCDIGGAGGFLAAHVAMNNQHMQCTSMDLPQVEPIAKENVRNMGLQDKVKITSGDFFSDDFPKSDIITMGNILHDWGTKDKKTLIKKAYNALPKGGAFVVIENIIDNDRSKNAFGLLMSLNMLIETEEGYDFSFSDFDKIVKEAGFKSTSIMPLKGPTSAAIAIK